MKNSRIREIRYLTPLSEIDENNDNIDIQVLLDDGRLFSFFIATPCNIEWCMNNEGIEYYFGVPPLFVKTINDNTIWKAINAILSENDGRWFEVYGTKQKE